MKAHAKDYLSKTVPKISSSMKHMKHIQGQYCEEKKSITFGEKE